MINIQCWENNILLSWNCVLQTLWYEYLIAHVFKRRRGRKRKKIMKCLPYIKPFLYASHCPKELPIYCVSSNNNTWGRHYHHQFTKKLGSKRFWKSAQGLAATTQRPTPSERGRNRTDCATNTHTHTLVSLAESLRLSLMLQQQHF